MAIAIGHAPKAAAQAAFMIISAITPDFTALPILGPMGLFIALNNGIKIIAAKAARNKMVIMMEY